MRILNGADDNYQAMSLGVSVAGEILIISKLIKEQG
jgi:hypothetical protein